MRSTGVITRKGQVTIPAEMRRALNLDEGDRVAFELVGDEIHVRSIGSVAIRTAGALKGNEPPASVEELRELAEIAISEDRQERTERR